MPDSTVPNLTAATAFTGTELFYVVQGGNDRKATATQVQTFIGSSVTIGTTVITGGTTGRLLYDNAGIVGEALLTYSAAQLQLGAADVAAPVAQTLGVQNVVTGTSNTAGSQWTIKGSAGTGTGIGGDIVIQTAPAGASSSTQNTFLNTLRIFGAGGHIKLLDVNTGVAEWVSSSNNAGLGSGGNLQVAIVGNSATLGLAVAADQLFGWAGANASTNVLGGMDTMMGRVAAATFRLGAADGATATAQTLQVQNVAAGNSNVNGANWTLNGSLSTGTGMSGDIIFQTGGTGAGATSQNAEVTALTIKGATQQVILATNLRINVTPTANTSASTTITNGADSASNLGHRLSFNFNGTTYWIPCGSTAF